MKEFARSHRYALTAFCFVFGSFPQWIGAVWGLFSSRPLAIVLEEKVKGVSIPTFSGNWITIPIALAMFILVLWAQRGQGDLVPRLALEILNRPELDGALPDPWLKIINAGPGTAFDIQIDPLENGPYRATFEPVHILRPAEDRMIRVNIREPDNKGIWTNLHIFHSLVTHGAPTSTATRKTIKIRFRDQTKKKRQISENVIYDPSTLHFYVVSKELRS